MPSFPVEIISNILSRLPVRSLCRFKCVSKPWLYLISSDPHFIKSHLNHNTKNGRFMLLSDSYNRTLPSYDFYSIDIESTQEESVVALHLKFPPLQNPSICNEFWGSCDGLVLMRNSESYSYFLVNPSTRESRQLPISPFANKSLFDRYRAGLGYDSTTDDYKVVLICHDNIASVYSLKTNSWRRIEDCPYGKLRPSRPIPGCFFNGALHWISFRNEFEVIVGSLDLEDEKFRCMPYPYSVVGGGGREEEEYLRVFGGCLCVLIWQRNGSEDVWVMKEYGVRDSWTKVTFTFDNFDNWKPLPLPCGSEVMLQWKGNKVVLLDPSDHKYKELVIPGLPHCFIGGSYIESLVSPNCNINNVIMRHHQACDIKD